jgi:REP element-mobilizing transposase RayT
MVQKHRIFTDKDYPYFVTCTIVDWLPLFTQASYQMIVLDALAYLRSNKHTQLNAFVLMPSHLHAILWPESGIKVSDVIRDFKRFTSRKISAAAPASWESKYSKCLHRGSQAPALPGLQLHGLASGLSP